MNPKSKINIILLLILYLLSFSYCYCESIKDDYIPIVSLSFPNHPEWKGWEFVVYQEKKKGDFLLKPVQLWSISPDKSKKSFCYIAHTKRYDYSYLRGDSIQPFVSNGERESPYPEAFLFTPIFRGGGSGEVQLISLLVPDMKKAKWKNLLPEIYITNLGEWKFLKCPLLSQRKLLVTADFIFSEEETHYSSHKYRIRIYNYSQKENNYILFDEYETNKKYYPLEGDMPPIESVINQEMKEILSRLKKIKSK